MRGPQAIWLDEQIDAVSPGISSSLPEISSIDQWTARKVLGVLLRFACNSSNAPSLLAGRAAVGKLPKAWLDEQLDDAVGANLNLNHEGDYRRLMELLEIYCPEKLSRYITIGLSSSDLGVQEAAADFKGQ